MKPYTGLYMLMLILLLGCRENYLPPAITNTNNYLVVDGMIRYGNDSTILKLTRTRNLGDTAIDAPELSARITIEGKNGSNYTLASLGRGFYGTGPLPLNPSEQYRLRISTSVGGLYESDYVPVMVTPEIDSIQWKQDSGVRFSVFTHDNINRTRYYRWEFEETWEYLTYFDTNLGFDYLTNQIFFRDSSQLLTRCWNSARSTDVLITTTANLAQDRVEDFQLQYINRGDDKMSTRYSILVKQYALTRESFEYWQLLRKNSKELGSIFGTQPSELIGNIRCISDPSEPVIGFMSVAAQTTKRIFVRNPELNGWSIGSTADILCSYRIVPPDSVSYYLQNDRDLSPAFFSGGSVPPLPAYVAIAKKICTDCTVRGGNTKKPSFW